LFFWTYQGGSGVGGGNFLEIGPRDVNLQTRNLTWLQKADLIFVVCQGDLFFNLLVPSSFMSTADVLSWWWQDNPVGVGYSYVEDPSALTKTDLQVATDLTKLLKALSKEIPTLQSSPLFLVGESYGGKFAALTGVLVARAIRASTLKLTLGGN